MSTMERDKMSTPSEQAEGADQQIRVDGFAQVLAMLQIADAEFRESLLKRLGQRDRDLARTLRADLKKMGL